MVGRSRCWEKIFKEGAWFWKAPIGGLYFVVSILKSQVLRSAIKMYRIIEILSVQISETKHAIQLKFTISTKSYLKIQRYSPQKWVGFGKPLAIKGLFTVTTSASRQKNGIQHSLNFFPPCRSCGYPGG